MVKRIRVTAESLVVSQHFCTNPLTRITGDEATMLVNHLALTWTANPAGGHPTLIRSQDRYSAVDSCQIVEVVG
jgi:hypothetical protein